MQPRPGSATAFVLDTLRQYPDRELQVRDIAELSAGRFQLANLSQSLNALSDAGLVQKQKEGRDVWWAIAAVVPADVPAVAPPEAQPGAVESEELVAERMDALAAEVPAVISEPPERAESAAEPAPTVAPEPSPATTTIRPPIPRSSIKQTSKVSVVLHAAAEPIVGTPRRPSRLVGPATARLQKEAWVVLDAPRAPSAAELVDLIHRVNPTGRGLDTADRAER